VATQLQLTDISISMTDEHTKEGITRVDRVDHVVDIRGFKNKIWKYLERKLQVALILSN
jgi:hypothetical protein